MNRINNSLLVSLFVLTGLKAYAQEKLDVSTYDIVIPSKQKKYHAKIILTNGQKIKGVIKSIGDEKLQLNKAVYKKSRGAQSSVTDDLIQNNEMYYGDIQSIKIRSVGATLGGAALGTIGGVVIGGLYGYLDCEDCNSSEREGKGFLLGLLGGVVGAVAGASVGPPSFEIAGQYSSYENFRNDMERRRMKKK